MACGAAVLGVNKNSQIRLDSILQQQLDRLLDMVGSVALLY